MGATFLVISFFIIHISIYCTLASGWLHRIWLDALADSALRFSTPSELFPRVASGVSLNLPQIGIVGSSLIRHPVAVLSSGIDNLPSCVLRLSVR